MPNQKTQRFLYQLNQSFLGSPTDEARCSLCGAAGPFLPLFPGASLRESRCPICGASRRTRDLARVLLRLALARAEQHADSENHSPATHHAPAVIHGPEVLADSLDLLRPLAVFELQAQGPLHALLHTLPGYVCSEFLPGLDSGQYNGKGLRCEDVTRLSFADAGFDLVISQDVMEHVEDTWQGFAEINRVLKPGGSHVFTVPVHDGRLTRQRAAGQGARQEQGGRGRDKEDGTHEGQRNDSRGDKRHGTRSGQPLTHFLPPVHHKDPLNPEGALVYWDFGDDLAARLAASGIFVEEALRAAWYAPEDIFRLDEGGAHARYLADLKDLGPAGVFLYNSVVFVADKG